MNEPNLNFERLLSDHLDSLKLAPGSLLNALVLSIEKGMVIVDAKLKSESAIALEEFKDAEGEWSVQVGDTVQVMLDAVENGFGETILSREKAKRCEAWQRLEAAQLKNETIIGIITGKVKGGFTVELADVRAFLPGSLIDVRPLKETSSLEGKPLEFKILKLDQKRNNVVVSRRAVLASEQSVEREKLLATLEEGQVLNGIVKNLSSYGAFIDLGSVDGLLHITDMAWRRIRDPAEVLSIGEEVKVKVLKFDRERNRVSLGLKQLEADPWTLIENECPPGTILNGKITNLASYGCFVGLDLGVEGLVHVSEMSWSNKVLNPSKLVNVGDLVQVMILDVDAKRRRISLSMKQCSSNPWEDFAKIYKKGDRLPGLVHSIAEFGLFVGLAGGIDGLVYLTDISWTEIPEMALKQYVKGQEVEVMVLNVDPDKERISLGIKQLTPSPAYLYAKTLDLSEPVEAVITSVDKAKKLVWLKMDTGLVGELPFDQLSGEWSDLKNNETILKVWIHPESLETAAMTNVLTFYLQSVSHSSGLSHTKRSEEQMYSAEEEEKTNPSVSPLNAMAEAFRLAKNSSNSK